MLDLATIDVLRADHPLLTLAIVIVVGTCLGLAARRLRLPAITGQILGGVALGQTESVLFDDAHLSALQPLTHFALGLMAVTVGAHLNVRKLRNAGRRLVFILLAEVTLVPALVFGAVWTFGHTTKTLALLLAASAIATAPATIVAVAKEARARGIFVKTLIGAVALNNMACMFLFEVARAFTAPINGGGDGGVDLIAGPLGKLGLALLIGGAVALAMETAGRFFTRSDRLATAGMISIVTTLGLASYLGASPLLACLFLGLVQANVMLTKETLVDSIFEDFQPVILAVFFTLAGLHLSFEHAATAGMLALLLFVARAAGKLLAGRAAMHLARAPEKVRKNLGMALIPQAGVAVALVILIQDDPDFAHVSELFSAAVLTVVTFNEILGPLLARLALERCGEAGMDRLRLIDFLQEENIVTDFHAATKREAIQRLVDLLVHSHHLQIDRDALLASVLERERQASTCFGGGLAVPHGILPDGHRMAGVMAISRGGLEFPTPDGRPVHCMVLLVTAEAERDRHLQVLGTLARMIGIDPVFQARLFDAKSPAHASELLHGEESEHFNYFLEDEPATA